MRHLILLGAMAALTACGTRGGLTLPPGPPPPPLFGRLATPPTPAAPPAAQAESAASAGDLNTPPETQK